MEVNLPSGFTANTDSLPALRRYRGVKRVDTEKENTKVSRKVNVRLCTLELRVILLLSNLIMSIVYRLSFILKLLGEESCALPFQLIEHQESPIKNQHPSLFTIIMTKQDELGLSMKVLEQLCAIFVILPPPINVPMTDARIGRRHLSQQDILRLKEMSMCWDHTVLDLSTQCLLPATLF